MHQPPQSVFFPEPTYLDKFIYSIITSYLGEFRALLSLQYVCKNAHGHSENMVTIRRLWNITTDKFILACQHGKIDMAIYFMPDTAEKIRLGFNAACSYGQLYLAKWLFSENSFSINHSMDLVFASACMNGHEPTARWLFTLGVNTSAQNDYAFRWTCEMGHLGIAQWLYSIGANNRIMSDYAFRWACSRNRLDVAKWLWCIAPDIQEDIKEIAFIESCIYGHESVARWLIEIGADPCTQNYKGLKKACRYDHLHIVKWLYSINAFDADHIKLALDEAHEQGNNEIIKWCSSMGVQYDAKK